MDWLFFNNLIGGKAKQALRLRAVASSALKKDNSLALRESAEESGNGPVHGWIAAGRDPRAVMTGGLMGASTLFR
jgi:hypothetical protein